MLQILKRLLFGAPEQPEPQGSFKPTPAPRTAPTGVASPEAISAARGVTSKQFGGFTAPLPKQPAPKGASAPFKRDLKYESSPGVREALEAIDAGAPAVLVSGRAGTGKTTLIRYLLRRPGGETTAVVAPTAVAALNAGAQTIHSFFRLPHNCIGGLTLSHFSILSPTSPLCSGDALTTFRQPISSALGGLP